MATFLFKWLLISAFGLSGLSSKTDRPVQGIEPDLRKYESTYIHPFYISVTEINHNSADKTLEFSFKLFADDFEETLEKNFRKVFDISSEKDKAAINELIPQYINSHFFTLIDSKEGKMNFIGFEIEKESVYCYFEIPAVSSVKKLDISNSILHDFKTEQINIMHVTVNGKRQSTKLDYPSTKANFVF